jgi:hypothetical protein
MMRWIGEAMAFLLVLGVLQFARLLVVLFCIAEVAVIFALWGVAFVNGQIYHNGYYVLMPLGMMVLVIIQVVLWKFMWLRLAQRGDHWRALAECFSRVVRYPISRPPHPWE